MLFNSQENRVLDSNFPINRIRKFRPKPYLKKKK